MISIIVTIYNSEKYLKEALDSIVNQTYQDYEVIMVNDGSADNSGAIALSYTNDHRFKLINSGHVGFPQAKNIGLSNVSGDYIIFLDSDDAAHPQWLEFLVKALEDNDADIVYCAYNTFCNGDEIINPKLIYNKEKIKDMSDQKMCPLFYGNCLAYMWNKLIKKELYEGIRFEDCIALSDSQVMYKIFDKAKKVYQLKEALVNYRQHSKSMSSTTRGTKEYWNYRLDLMLKVLTFVFDKYDISKFICRVTLNNELFKVRKHVPDSYYKNIYNCNKKKIEHILKGGYECDFDVDLVVPFVDNRDKVWQKVYVDYTHSSNYENNSRFDNPDLFEFFLRGVDKFMPWVRKIHLIVSNIEQVPTYINKEKTHIVLHKDIIPEKYLPTFNSSTIEMFIANVDGLSEHFIYANDDMYPIREMNKADFFSEDGKPKIVFKRNYINDDMSFFGNLCLNVYKHTAEVFNYPFDGKSYLRPEHTLASLRRSHCLECVKKMWHYIEQDLGAFRTARQHTQYMYALYEKFSNGYAFGGPFFKYHGLGEDRETVVQELKYQACQILCLNGVPDNAISKEYLDEIVSLLKENLGL